MERWYVRMPRVSVVMPVYNSEKYVKDAIESILQQTYKDLEIIVINDCSKDKSAEVIKQIEDDRIVFVNNEENKGFLYGLNLGISLAKGEYIARLDDDDIAYPTRIEKQVKFLDQHKDVVLLGTGIDYLIDGKKEPTKEIPIKTPEQIKFSLVFGNFFIAHSSFMMRKDVLIANHIQYEKYLQVPDHHMLMTIVKYGKLAALEEPLNAWRIHAAQSTQVRTTRMKTDEADNARMEFLNDLEMDDEIKKGLKYGILREIKTKQQLEQFADAFIKYSEICGLTDSEPDRLCKQFIFSWMIKQQYKSIQLLLACQNKKIRKLFYKKMRMDFIIDCVKGKNASYVSTTLKL